MDEISWRLQNVNERPDLRFKPGYEEGVIDVIRQDPLLRRRLVEETPSGGYDVRTSSLRTIREIGTYGWAARTGTLPRQSIGSINRYVRPELPAGVTGLTRRPSADQLRYEYKHNAVNQGLLGELPSQSPWYRSQQTTGYRRTTRDASTETYLRNQRLKSKYFYGLREFGDKLPVDLSKTNTGAYDKLPRIKKH